VKKLRFVVLGTVIATTSILYFNWDRIVGTDSLSTKQASQGVLETADFTIPIPSGYHVLSKEELLARVAKAKRNSPRESVVATLENPERSLIVIARAPPSKADEPSTPPTTEECTSLATLYSERGNHRVITGGTLVDYPRDGLGVSCEFTLNIDDKHTTLVLAADWWFLTCIHPPGQYADCRQVATGFKRRTR